MNYLKLSVYLRTHDSGNFHNNQRFVNLSKKDITKSSFRSLIQSIDYYGKENVSLTIIDDHSSEETLSFFSSVLSFYNIKSKIVSLETTGNTDSLRNTYELALKNGSNLIYFVEDDHIHKKTAIKFMVEAWEEFTFKLNKKQVAIAPYDDPLDYFPDRIIPSRIVASKNCHWRQNFHTTCTMMITKWVLLHFWDRFMTLTNYGVNGINEDNTINPIYKQEDVILFTPIPFQAIHLNDISPYVENYKEFLIENFKN